MPKGKREQAKQDTTESGLLSQQPSLREASSKGAMSKEEIAQLGQEAATALSSPIYETAFQMTLSQIVASWLQSEEHETQRRESLYLQAQNLQIVEQMLVENVNQLQQQNLSEQEKAEEDLSLYENYQGFGLMDLPSFQESP